MAVVFGTFLTVIAEDFYRNDYPEEDYQAIEDADSDNDSTGLREGLDFMAIQDDSLGLHDADEFHEEWSEDENFEQYRDRILNQLEDRISQNNQ